jgi:hypothetical protein
VPWSNESACGGGSSRTSSYESCGVIGVAVAGDIMAARDRRNLYSITISNYQHCRVLFIV